MRRDVPSQLLAKRHIKYDTTGEAMEKNEEVMTVDNIRNHLYFIKGQQVMLDQDLADIYGYEVKRLNEQVIYMLATVKYNIL